MRYLILHTIACFLGQALKNCIKAQCQKKAEEKILKKRRKGSEKKEEKEREKRERGGKD